MVENYTFTQTARILGIKREKLIGYMLEKRHIHRDLNGRLQAYLLHIQKGLFVIVPFRNHKTGYSGLQTRVTDKGRAFFKEKIQKDSYFI